MADIATPPKPSCDYCLKTGGHEAHCPVTLKGEVACVSGLHCHACTLSQMGCKKSKVKPKPVATDKK